MKTLLRTIMLAVLITLFSCKKNENVTVDPYAADSDTTQTTIDSVGPGSDSTNTSTDGTTGAVGEGSTGSGTDGSTQKGAVNVKTDSVSGKKGK